MARRPGAATALPADIRHRPHRNGKSDKPLDGWDYTFANDARIVEALMDEWGHDEMIVVGDDWGGGIALTVAAEYPDRTDLCVWMNSTSYD